MVHKILIIHPDRFFSNELKLYLEFDSHEIHIAENGMDGIRSALTIQPSLIICNLNLTYCDGISVLKKVRSNDGTFQVPFMLVSSKTSRKDQRMAFDAGADDFFLIPFQKEDLKKSIDIRIKRYEEFVKLKSSLASMEKGMSLLLGHECNNPMHIIKNSNELIFQRSILIEDKLITEFAGYINTSFKRIIKTISKTKDYLQLKELALSGFLKSHYLKSIDCFPEKYFQEISEKIAVEHGRSGDLKLIFDIKNHIPLSHGISVIYLELLENAFKFTPKGSAVNCFFYIDHHSIKIEIRDFGTGIDAEQFEYYEPFRQFNRKKQEQQGVGIGLALSKQIASLLNGFIQFKSNSPNGIISIIAIPVVEDHKNLN